MGSRRKIPAKLGEKLAKVRKDRGYSMAEMAEFVSDDEIRIAAQDVFRYEKGQSDPPLQILLHYSEIASVPMDVFANDKLEMPE
jgi:transcriptional regulator with XRE-family HTH domain